jgi:transcriptional regulator with XRE-family HTH domain
MRLDAARVRALCVRKGLTLQDLLREAGVSRTAYYSQVRKESVLPVSIRALAGTLGIAPSSILEEAPAEEWHTRALIRCARRILARNPGASFDNVWHTLVLLEEKPEDRLRRSLLRGRAGDLH